jgi:two-component system, LuxR family, sensor kinase FixL
LTADTHAIRVGAAQELEALLDAAVDAVIVISHDSVILTFNRAAERLFGYAAADVLGQDISVLMPEPYRSAHAGYVGAYLETGRARIIGIGREITARRQDGSLFPAALSVGRIRGVEPPRFVGFIQDITTRKAALEALRFERDRAQTYLDVAEVILLALDAQGAVTMLNRRGQEILGYTEAELIGSDWFDMCVPPPARRERRERFEQELSFDALTMSESRSEILTRDGVRRLIAWRTTPLLDHSGRAIGCLASGEDITERQAAEDALRQSEALLRSAQSIAQLGNFEVVHPDGPNTWSEQLYQLLGMSIEEGPVSVPEFAARFVHPDDLDHFNQEWTRARVELQRFDFEFRIRRLDGSIRYMHSLGIVSAHPDGVIATGTLHDITDRKLAELELRVGQERLTHVARLSTMGEMATGLAHEINQPLTAIANYAQAAVRMMDAPGGTDLGDVREALVQIVNQSLRAGEVIRRLRAFVKSRTSRSERLEINRLVEDVWILAVPDARVNDMRLVLELDGESPVVAGDPVQLQQVLLNLVRNAIDATCECTTALRELTIATRDLGDTVEVAVVDHAGGIPESVAQNLFNPFYTTKETGTGLGLAISRSIITAHRGKLGYRPTPGGGTTFFFTLPQLVGV